MKKILILILIVLSSSADIFAQITNPRLKKIHLKLVELHGKKSYDSIGYYTDKYLLNEDLTNHEQQFVYYHKALLYHKIERYNQEIEMLKKSNTFFNPTDPNAVRLNDFTNYMYADVLFTKKKYKQAFEYAQKVKNAPFILNDPNAFIIMQSIIGYYYFLQLDYQKSEQAYTLAARTATKSNRCQLPIVYSKIAKIYSRQKRFYDAKKIIEKSISISDSCKETINKINAIKSLREILVENGEFEEANKVSNNLDNLRLDADIEMRNKKIDSLETIFKTQLKESQNKLLSQANAQKSKQLSMQKWGLIGAGIGIFLLSILLFYDLKLSKKQKKLNVVLAIQKIEIEKSNTVLERLNFLNQKIFSVVSHDFRAPMVNLEMLLKTNVTNETADFYANRQQNIANNLGQANQIMDNLMTWSKRELGFSDNVANVSNVFDVVSKVVLQLDNVLIQKKLEVINDIPTNKSIGVPSDILMIVFRNIINNAIKFSFEENNIVVDYNETTNEFSVHDFGIGMTENQVQNIFNTNIVSKPGTNNEAGFGIGLQFVHQLVLQNNGNIRIESVLNEGTIVYLKFE